MAELKKFVTSLMNGTFLRCVLYSNDLSEGEIFCYKDEWNLLVLKKIRSTPDAISHLDESEDEKHEYEIICLWELEEIILLLKPYEPNSAEPAVAEVKKRNFPIKRTFVRCILYDNDIFEGEILYYINEWNILVLKKNPSAPDAISDLDESEDEKDVTHLYEFIRLRKVQEIIFLSKPDEVNPSEPIHSYDTINIRSEVAEKKKPNSPIKRTFVLCILYDNDIRVFEGEIFYYINEWNILVLKKNQKTPDAISDLDESEDEKSVKNNFEFIRLCKVQKIILISKPDEANPAEPIHSSNDSRLVNILSEVAEEKKPNSLTRRYLEITWKMCVNGFNSLRKMSKMSSHALKKFGRTFRPTSPASRVIKKTQTKRRWMTLWW